MAIATDLDYGSWKRRLLCFCFAGAEFLSWSPPCAHQFPSGDQLLNSFSRYEKTERACQPPNSTSGQLLGVVV